jgi:uncharacterized phage infection (PIP) family protein YhgE
MDTHLYVDQYLRRRKGVAFPAQSVEEQQLNSRVLRVIDSAAQLRQQASSLNAPPPPPPQPIGPPAEIVSIREALGNHAEVVHELAINVQKFVDRTDTLNLQVQTVEDKILNLTKMLKVAQELSDDQVQSLSEQLDSLRNRLEESVDREETARNDLEDFKKRVPGMIDDAVSRAVASVRDDVRREADSALHRIEAVDKAQITMRADLLASFGQQLETTITAKLAQEHEKTSAALKDLQHAQKDLLRDVERDIHKQLNERRAIFEAEIRQMARGRDQESVATTDYVRRVFDDRISSILSQCREVSQSDTRQAIMAAQTAMHDEAHKSSVRMQDEFKELSSRLDSYEEQTSTIEGSFAEFIAAFKEHTAHQAAKMDDTAQSMKDLMELHDETRNAVATEIENTKQWATRNMVRLKKHLDNVNIDVHALKDAHRDLHLVVERMRLAQTDESNRLSDLVAQRSRERDALVDMVDREVASVQNIARAYRQGHAPVGDTVGRAMLNPRTAPAPARGGSRAAGRMGASDEDRASSRPSTTDDDRRAARDNQDDEESALERLLERRAARSQKIRSLFSELNFRERNVAPVTADDDEDDE